MTKHWEIALFPVQRVAKKGGSLFIVIPRKLAEDQGIEKGDLMSVKFFDKHIIYKKEGGFESEMATKNNYHRIQLMHKNKNKNHKAEEAKSLIDNLNNGKKNKPKKEADYQNELESLDQFRTKESGILK